MFVAVVVNQDPYVSRSPEGSNACFTGPTKEAAIRRAVYVLADWERRNNKRYRIVVAEVTEEVEILPSFATKAYKEQF